MRFPCFPFATCLALLLGATGPVRSAVIYSGLQDIAIGTNFEGVYLDIQTGVSSYSGHWDINPFFGGVGVATNNTFQAARVGTGNLDAFLRFGAGDTVGDGLLFSSGYGGSQTHLGSSTGQFGIGDEGYLAFRFITNDGLANYYGWMRVVFTANTVGALIKDWAYDDSGSAITAGRVEQLPASTGVPPVPAEAGVQWTTFSPGAGENITYGSFLGDPGAGTVTSVLKTGAGTTALIANHNFTGQTMVSGGILEVANGGKLSGTTKVTVNDGGTLLFSGPGGLNARVNGGASMTLNGGTLSTAALTSSLDQQFGALTLSQTSTIDFSLLAAGNTVRFADSSAAAWTGGQILKIFNYTSGVDHLFFGSSSSGIAVGQLSQVRFYSDSGVTLIGSGFHGLGGEVIVPVPEPSGLMLSLSLLGLAAFRDFHKARASAGERRRKWGVRADAIESATGRATSTNR